SGKLPSFELEYPCHSPEEKRWFVGRVTPTQGDGPGRVVIAHENITERKQATEAQRHSNELMQYIIAHTNSAVAVHDRDLHYMYVSKRYLEDYGVEEQDIIGKHHYDVFPDLPEKWRNVHRKALAGEVSSSERDPYERADGTVEWTRWECRPWYEANGSIGGIIVYTEVITERVQAEDVLHESRQRLEFALQGGKLGAWDWNPQDGTVLYSDLWAQMLEYRPEEVEPTVDFFKQHVHPEDSSAVLDRLTGHVEGRLPAYESEHRIRTKSGRWLWVLDRGRIVERDKDSKPVRVTGVIADITERKQAEETLIRQQRSIKLTNRIANIFLTSSRNEVFADVLDVLLKALDSRFGYFGYIDEAGDLISPSLTHDVWDQCQVAEKSIVFPRSGWSGLWGRSLMEKQTLVANENLRVPEGHVALENALATPIVHHDKLIGQFVVADKAGGYDKDDRDLLESVAAQTAPILFAIQEEARQKTAHEKLEEQMRQAQKMEAVGRLAGGVAHDFNNMLGIILGHADMILEGLTPDQPFHADLTEIRKAGERSADLTRQLLAFARKQTVAPKVIDLNKTVEGMLKMLHRLIGEDIDMAWIPGEKVWPVKIDPAQIDQVLANLCVNARDAIADVGKVTIETGNSVFDEEYCKEHAGFVTGEYTLLTVSDNGCGMDKETLENIFEPFFTTKESDKGTGLGLATVYGVVKQNNGFINVYSEPGQGTTFRIYLPRHRVKEASLPDKEAIRPAARGHETILLVEDEPAILRMTMMMLERTGYKVLAAGTPGEAIALAREHAGEIHLLMTDVVMPEMNGRDLAKNLLSLYPNLKRLFMSGYTANVIAHHGVLDEGVQFIQKPFAKQDLAIKVREVLNADNL
ncbi:MAG: PAS domain S-box protein, partial [Deltaproteobacteria bacterium]|nr:PAS domain S-box protein [Deltaproteobacteria bacterium]